LFKNIVFRKIENCGECGLCLLLCNRNIFDFPRTGRLPFEPVVPTPTETKVHDPGTMEQRQILRHQKNSDSQFGIGPISCPLSWHLCRLDFRKHSTITSIFPCFFPHFATVSAQGVLFQDGGSLLDLLPYHTPYTMDGGPWRERSGRAVRRSEERSAAGRPQLMIISTPHLCGGFLHSPLRFSPVSSCSPCTAQNF